MDEAQKSIDCHCNIILLFVQLVQQRRKCRGRCLSASDSRLFSVGCGSHCHCSGCGGLLYHQEIKEQVLCCCV